MENKKRASGHIEVMISFVIFIGLIVFLFIMLNPLKIFSASKSMLDTTTNKVIENVSTELTTSSVKVQDSYILPEGLPKDCLTISLKSKAGEELIVKNGSGSEVESAKGTETLSFKYDGSNRFYRISLSENIFPTKLLVGSSCATLEPTDYQLGITRTRDIISSEKLKTFTEEYTEDYDALKTSLGLENNFNFIIFKGDGSIFEVDGTKIRGQENPPGGINVLAKDVVIEILNKSADIIPAIMNIRAWE